jgi:hypothetical protein
MRLAALLIVPAILLLAACGGGSGTTETTSTRTPGVELPAPVPDGTIAVSDFRLFSSDSLAATLVTLPITAEVPDGYKTTWYTYKDGEWTALERATVVGGNAPTAQTTFSPVPENLIVLAEPE